MLNPFKKRREARLKFEKQIDGVFRNWVIDFLTLESPRDNEGFRYEIWHYESFKDYATCGRVKKFLTGFYEWEIKLLRQELEKECRRRAEAAIKTKDFTKHFAEPRVFLESDK